MFHFFHTGLFTGDPDATSDVMRLVSTLVVEQESGDARERQFFDAAQGPYQRIEVLKISFLMNRSLNPGRLCTSQPL